MNEFKRRFSSYQENVPLAPLTTMGVGGKSKYFIEAEKIDDLVEAVLIARKEEIPYLVLGGGSNIVFDDSNFSGLVILNKTGELIISSPLVIVDSGMILAHFLKKLAAADLGGFEFLSGIPGTVGGAVIDNAGAYGGELSEFFENAVILDSSGKIRTIDRQAMNYTYRNSLLKKNIKQGNFEDSPVLLKCKFKFFKSNSDSVIKKMENIVRMRTEKQPTGKSSGSIFQNFSVSANDERWQKIAREGKISAGYFIEEVGLKGKTQGGAKISEKHANWLINENEAKSEDLWRLKEEAKTKVKEKFDIDLKEEVIFLKDVKKE